MSLIIISEIFTAEFGTFVQVCKDFTFSYLRWSSVIIYQLSQKVFKMSSICLHTSTQMSLPMSNCSADDLVVKSRITDFTDLHAVEAHLHLDPDCIVHQFDIRAVSSKILDFALFAFPIWGLLLQHFTWCPCHVVLGLLPRAQSHCE